MNKQKSLMLSPLSEKYSPPVYHSFIYCLATVLNFIDKDISIAEIMGKSSFAFRVYANNTFCPSAQSCFLFKELLPFAIEQNGYHCSYLEKSIGNDKKNIEVIDVAHQMIHEAINKYIPAIAWDVSEVEWGVIYGYDDKTATYTALNHNGEIVNLPYEKLGRNGTNFLSISIPGPSNGTTDQEALFNLLHSVKDHLASNENYEMDEGCSIGLSAFDRIIEELKKWIQVLDTGENNHFEGDYVDNVRYTINHLYSARYYAVKYLEGFNDSGLPKQLHRFYDKIEQLLLKHYNYFNKNNEVNTKKLESFVKDFCRIKSLETEILNIIN